MSDAGKLLFATDGKLVYHPTSHALLFMPEPPAPIDIDVVVTGYLLIAVGPGDYFLPYITLGPGTFRCTWRESEADWYRYEYVECYDPGEDVTYKGCDKIISVKQIAENEFRFSMELSDAYEGSYIRTIWENSTLYSTYTYVDTESYNLHPGDVDDVTDVWVAEV
jgi:hypothetical protein